MNRAQKEGDVLKERQCDKENETSSDKVYRQREGKRWFR